MTIRISSTALSNGKGCINLLFLLGHCDALHSCHAQFCGFCCDEVLARDIRERVSSILLSSRTR